MSIRSNRDARSADQRITIQRKTETQDAYGDPVVSWADLVTCWASVDGEKAGGERYVNDGIRSVADYTFWVRSDIFSRFSLNLTDRIVWGGENYNISDMPNQQLRGRWIAIMARTGMNAG